VNIDKTQFIWLGAPSQQFQEVDGVLVSTVEDLDITLDAQEPRRRRRKQLLPLTAVSSTVSSSGRRAHSLACIHHESP